MQASTLLQLAGLNDIMILLHYYTVPAQLQCTHAIGLLWLALTRKNAANAVCLMLLLMKATSVDIQRVLWL
jgi:hypothetical protein